MKKIYMQPSLEEMVMSTSSIITASDIEITEDVHNTEIDGDKAWSRLGADPRVWENDEQ